MKQQQNVKLNIKGIKCDNPICDYKDMSVEYSDYPKWLNKPCPKCGENLLTEADYKTLQDLVDVVDLVNSMKLSKEEKLVKGAIYMNGTGKWSYEIEDNNK